ncbi:ribokinase [Corynebacterium appendicis]|uniref:ribokinase n=1 Tax=Corynebacterium appendicis TaxID=163202 RepID=UPI00223AFF92|nr:ribokinase [Corynebacterium appendicis]MCT1683342.1 ribokinase [Corynebacterium appendicis]MDK8625510.1 ribokinase [Corynebacterium appendicis]
MQSPRITVVGSINADLTVNVPRHPTPGETLLGSGGGITPGGKGANQAVAAARLGSSVALVGAIGNDAHADEAQKLLIDAAVDLTALETLDAPTGLAVITVAADGENTVMVVPGANGEVGAGVVDKHVAEVSGADLVLLQGEIPADGFTRAVELATGRVVVNLAPVIDVDRSALRKADPLIVNEHEAQLVLGRACPPERCIEDLLREFTSVVVTLGASGALVATPDGVARVDSPVVEAVDTVGAGDAFTGALCHRLVEGDSLEEAARFAARVGAFSVTRPGAQPSYPWSGDKLP